MTLELADHLISRPVGVAEDVFVKVEVDAFLVLEDDPTLPEVDQSYVDTEGDILLLESFLNDDPSLPPPKQGNYLPQVRKELKIYEAKTDKSSIEEPPKVELKDLPPHLEYAFLEGDDKLPVIIAKDLKFCTHKIPMEEDFEPAVQHQRRVNPKIHDVIKNEVLKLVDAGLIYPISDSPWNAPPTLKDPKFWTAEEKKTQKIDRLARSLLIQGLPNDIYSLIDSNETAKDLWDTLESCEFNYKFLNNLQQEWKQYATLMRQTKNLIDINIDALYNILKQNQGDVNDALRYKKKAVVVHSDPLALVAEKTNVSKRKEKVVVSLDSEGSGHFAKDCKKVKFKDYEYYKTKMLLAKKDKDEQVLLAEDQAWMESSKYYDNSTNFGLFVNNEDDQDIFHDAIEYASENFIENHIDSQKDYDKSDVDHNDSEEKDHLVDKLIRKFNKKIVKCQKRVDKVNQQNLDTFSNVRRPKNSGVIWKKKGSSNNSNVGLSPVSVSNLNKNVKRYSRKDLMNDLLDDNNFFIFDDESDKISHVCKIPFRKKPRDSMNIVQICLWIIDSGCSKHMTGNRAMLTNFVEKFPGTVGFGNNDFAVIAGYGDVVIGSMMIKKVYYVKGLGHNLFSVGQFCDKGLKVAFRKSTSFFQNEDGVDLLTGDRSLNLYTIALNEVASNSSTCLLAKASSSQSWLWHQRLLHLYTMLTFANLPSFLWAEAIITAYFTQNRLIIHKHFDKTPYELINKRKPNIKFFRVFGCRCYLLNDYEDVGKLKAKGDIRVFVGYSKKSAAFRIYNK
nr:integrase, catalytic region, zinc finger, CCHC-type, peptidase aspartic, catalytic [Tanacetum cinerariifolium]